MLRKELTRPLLSDSEGSDSVSEVVGMMNEYDLLRDDFDNIINVTQYPGMEDPLSKIQTKVKLSLRKL